MFISSTTTFKRLPMLLAVVARSATYSYSVAYTIGTLLIADILSICVLGSGVALVLALAAYY